MTALLVRRPGAPHPLAVLRRHEDFGVEELDLARPPMRFWADGEMAPPSVEIAVDARRVEAVPTPAEMLRDHASTDGWQGLSRRSLARLHAWFLVAEDPQRRLDAQEVVTLAHQASLVRHVLQEPSLRRALIADEVGLGKTVEAGLLVRDLLAQQPGLRVLYLAPARLAANVRREFDRLGLSFRLWVAGDQRDARLDDPRVVASIHRAVHSTHFEDVVRAGPWDVVIVDECHHLSDWEEGGGSPVRQYRLVRDLAARLSPASRLVLMSGTPHQGHAARFDNLMALLQEEGEPEAALRGRVIYRTKDDVRDWDGQPLFPGRRVNPPLVIDLGEDHRSWLRAIHALYEPARGDGRRAATWRAGQALQWATSSVQAGTGYLVRQAIRAGWDLGRPELAQAISELRPYRGGPPGEPVPCLFDRICREVGRQREDADLEDIEEDLESRDRWAPDNRRLGAVLDQGVDLLRRQPDAKWEFLRDRVLAEAADEKVVLFAQPIETVSALAGWIERTTGARPAIIIGAQDEAERRRQVDAFWRPDGPRYLVSSRAGGEGLNLQVARRLVHVDVPWNPMELEQRVGRVHRFLSRRTVVVDTLVVRDSRETDMYRVARDKLREVARTLVPEDRFDALFARVMALVPPEDLIGVLGERPLAPLDDAERARVASLVTQGFQAWQAFHERYASQQRQIRALDPGQATWDDLGMFARSALRAAPAEGYSALRFRWEADEVVERGARADVLEVDGTPYACGDYGGMPVHGPDGVRAAQLGLNVPAVCRALRRLGFPEVPAGAAQLRWPDDLPRPVAACSGPFGVVVLARQSLRSERGTYVEVGTTLHAFIARPSGEVASIEGGDKGDLVRALLRSPVRKEAEPAAELVAAIVDAESAATASLRRPSEEDRSRRVSHAVTPLLAAVVS